MDAVTVIARQLFPERDRAPGLAVTPPQLTQDMELWAECDAGLPKELIKIVDRHDLGAAGRDL